MSTVADKVSAPARPEHGETLRRLEKIIRCYRGFRVALALYNDPPAYRNRLIAHLDGLVSRPGLLDVRDCSDFAVFETRLAEAAVQSDLIHVVGLDAWLREEVGRVRMQGFNLHREALAAECGKPLVLWLPTHLATPFALEAPDFWEWRQAVVDFSVERNVVLPEALETVLDRIAGARKLSGQVEFAGTMDTKDEDWSHARFKAEQHNIEQALGNGRLAEALDMAASLYRRTVAAGDDAYPGADYDLALASLVFGRVLSSAGIAEQAVAFLEEAGQRFEQIALEQPGLDAERMAALALDKQGDCMYWLGRYDRATTIYQKVIRRAERFGDKRLIAVAKGQIAAVSLGQKRYAEALASLAEARDAFASLGEFSNVATSWYSIGIAQEKTGFYEEAERAYRESLAIETRLGDSSGEASGLNQLGNLYDRINRLQDAVTFYAHAAAKFMEIGDVAGEGAVRSNLADTLRKLGRIAEARAESLRAIECRELFGHTAEPWIAWQVLQDIEIADDQPQAAATARGKALESFLAYRRDGGENHSSAGRLCADVAGMLEASKADEAIEMLRELRNHPDWQCNGLPLLDTLDAIAAGHRDPALADNLALTYDQSAEIMLLLERLSHPAK